MSWKVLAPAALFVGFLVALVLTRLRQLDAELDVAEHLLGATRSGHEVAGRLDGVAIAYGSRGSRSASWTEVRATVRPAGVEVVVRPRRAEDDAAVAAGRLLDVDLGDAELRKAYVVDGAPAEAVAAMLDAEVRRQILALRPGLISCSGEQVRVAADHLVRDDAEATGLLRLTAALGSKLAVAGATEVAATAAVRARHEAERDALFVARASDRKANLLQGLVVAGVLVLLFALGLVWALKRRAAGTP
jgi:hypothetical protein